MEETVWMYFGILAVIIGIGIITTIFTQYKDESSGDTLFLGVQQLGKQAELVCASPRDTKLSIEFTVPSGTLMYTKSDKLCARLDDKIRCLPSTCLLEEKVLINLTSDEAKQLFDTWEYTCAVHNDDVLRFTCQG